MNPMEGTTCAARAVLSRRRSYQGLVPCKCQPSSTAKEKDVREPHLGKFVAFGIHDRIHSP